MPSHNILYDAKNPILRISLGGGWHLIHRTLPFLHLYDPSHYLDLPVKKKLTLNLKT